MPWACFKFIAHRICSICLDKKYLLLPVELKNCSNRFMSRLPVNGNYKSLNKYKLMKYV